MATTNLIERTLGAVLLQSGTGTPDHVATRGSMYTNNTTGIVYVNISEGGSGTTWRETFDPLWRAGMNAADRSTTYTPANGWVEFTETGILQVTTGSAIDSFTFQTAPNDYFVQADRAGDYLIWASAVYESDGNNADVSFGISINTAVPDAKDISTMRILDGIMKTGTFTVYAKKTIAKEDRISLAFNVDANRFRPINLALFMIRV